MRLNLLLFSAVMLTALAASLFAATRAVNVIESRSEAGVETVLSNNGFDWAEVEVDGLRVQLSGTAPDEANRFAAIRAAGTVIDASRIVDQMDVAAAAVIEPPRFSIEILRNGDDISVIGLFPLSEDREKFLDAVESIATRATVVDLMETSDFPAPDGWSEAVDFGVEALSRLPRSKISISTNRIAITAMADDERIRQALEQTFTNDVPEGITLDMDISAPRPVITPFTLRLVMDDNGPRFDACSAGTEEGLAAIVAASQELGLDMPACRVGLGSPSPDWARAVTAGLAAIKGLGGGTLTFSDTDVSLIALEDTDQATFDAEIGTLEAALPPAFSLTAVLPRPEGTNDQGPPRFSATRSPEGLVQLRGGVIDASAKAALSSFAIARFGVDHVSDGTRIADDLPAGWSPRLLAALDAMTLLHNGSVVVEPDSVAISGVSGLSDARAEIARRLSAMLGEGADFEIDVTYERRLDPTLNLPTAANCVERINHVLNASQITFAPGSDEIEGSASSTLDQVSDILKECREVDMQLEIGGHTDSQGRESMNQELSQQRAEAVLEALRLRRAPTSRITAHGYGEEFPIADNDTPEGREANRRIEFKLISADEGTDADGEVAQEDAPQAEAAQDGEAGDETNEQN